MLYTPEIDMEPKSHQIKREVLFKTYPFFGSILIFQGIPCLFKHFVTKMLRKQRESNEKTMEVHLTCFFFFSDTESSGVMECFPLGVSFSPVTLQQQNLFLFGPWVPKKSIFKNNSPEFLARC